MKALDPRAVEVSANERCLTLIDETSQAVRTKRY
jgi:hypothetical protein